MTDIPQAEPVDPADMAFLFEENGGTRYAITRDVMGAKLPDAPRGWSVTSTFLLAVVQVMLPPSGGSGNASRHKSRARYPSNSR